MQKIIVVADGAIAEAFIEKISNKKVPDLEYTIILKEKKEKFQDNSFIKFFYFDPTSIFHLKKVCKAREYNAFFIVMQNMQESLEVYKNLRSLNKKVRAIVLDLENRFKDFDDSYLYIVDAIEILSTRLYDFLPNVPVFAQTIGLNQGEIMEVAVPFSSSYAFRHIGSIPQIKWRIAAIYRDNKLILPTSATMIKPRDRLLIVGKPQVLANVYNRIKNKSGIFPEPFGKNFYLFLSLEEDKKNALRYIKESILFLDKFEKRELIVRVSNIDSLELLEEIKKFENDNIKILVSYDKIEYGTIYDDIQKYDVGLIIISNETFQSNDLSKELFNYKKLIYILGKEPTEAIKEAVIVNSGDKKVEEISTIAFYIAEAFKLKLDFLNYDPSREKKENKELIEHISTLSHVYNYPVDIKQKHKNPIRDIKSKKNILLIIPYTQDMDIKSLWAYFKRDIDSILLRISKHPKLLIPIEENSN
jgi:hypothetical protein